MHTFFINTTDKNADSYKELLDIHVASMEFVTLDCPIGEWNDEERGYRFTVRRMGELIDTYSNITNDFNLIVYVDLTKVDAYSSIPSHNNIDRCACTDALHTLFTHYVKETVVNELCANGRRPTQVTVIYEEGEALVGINTNSREHTEIRNKYLKKFLGLPEADTYKTVIESWPDAGDRNTAAEWFANEIRTLGYTPFLDGLYDCYMTVFAAFIKGQLRSRDEGKVLDSEYCGLLSDIYGKLTDEADIVKYIEFYTNPTAIAVNRSERALRELRLNFYLLECLLDGKLWIKDKNGKDDIVRPMSYPSAARVYSVLLGAKEMYDQQLAVMESSHETLGLTPQLKSITTPSDFGVNSRGVTDVGVKKRTRLIPTGMMIPFAQKYTVLISDITRSGKKSRSADDYIDQAREICAHHRGYLDALGAHVMTLLSNYAGPSETRRGSTVFGKRSISASGKQREDTLREERFSKSDDEIPAGYAEDAAKISDAAYRSAEKSFLEFCKTRSVTVTDLTEESESYRQFESEIRQIEESIDSLKRKGIAAFIPIGIAAIFVLPYLLIQLTSLFSNPISVLVAILCAVLSLSVYGAVYGIVIANQYQRYGEVLDEFNIKSENALAQNRRAVEEFEEFLTVYAPSLRWIHEYRLDVAAYEECKTISAAKILHHKEMINTRIKAIDEMLGVLEIDRHALSAVERKRLDIDFNLTYCTGETNRNVYSIIDAEAIEALKN